MDNDNNRTVRGGFADKYMAAVCAAVIACAAGFVAVSLCRGTLHVMAFFWCALAAGLAAAHLDTRVRRIRKRDGREGRR